jgi:3-oxoacyl-[acyl-carrier-protein] synthase-1
MAQEQVQSPKMVITGIGMMSSLGGHIQACAAHRVNQSNVKTLNMLFNVDDSEYPEQAKGHECDLVAGYEGFGRLGYLLKLAFDDLAKSYDAGFVREKRTALLLCAPESECRPMLDKYERDNEKDGDDLIIDQFLNLNNFSNEFTYLRVLRGSQASAVSALNLAAELFDSQVADICIIGGVDSYMDEPSLEWLYSTQQLKTPEGGDGALPGEGAAFLIAERKEHAMSRDAAVLAEIDNTALEKEIHSYQDEEYSPDGERLSSVITTVLSCSPENVDQTNLVINDLNGHRQKSQEWGNAIVKLNKAFDGQLNMRMWTPATSFGEIGAATGFFQICLAIRAFARKYAPSNRILLCASSYDGDRGAILVSNPVNVTVI